MTAMVPRPFPTWLVAGVALVVSWLPGRAESSPAANRLTHLAEPDPFAVGRESPRLTTPQWIGEPEVVAAVILSVDDLREPARHEAFLRPILERLKRIDGRAALSVMANDVAVTNATLQAWRREGGSIEVDTVTHRHPLLTRVSQFGE